MLKMSKFKITRGVYWLEVPEINFYLVCGCPADTVKHLMKRGLIVTRQKNGVTFETGPNAILLSDVSVQNGFFSKKRQVLIRFGAHRMLEIDHHFLSDINQASLGAIEIYNDCYKHCKGQGQRNYRKQSSLAGKADLGTHGYHGQYGDGEKSDPDTARDSVAHRFVHSFLMHSSSRCR